MTILSKRKLIQELEPYLLERSLNSDGDVTLSYCGMPSNLFEHLTLKDVLMVTCLFGYTVKIGKAKYKIKSYTYKEQRDQSPIYKLGNIPASYVVEGKRSLSAVLILEVA